MQNIVKGTYAVVDVGRLQTKILIVKTTKPESDILDCDIFPTPEDVIEKDQLYNFDHLADFVKDALAAMNRKKLRRVYLVSSHLGITSEIRGYSTEDLGSLESKFEEDDQGKRYPTNIEVRSFKSFKEERTADEIKRITVVDTANIELMIAINKSFAKKDLELICATDEITSMLAILQVSKITYDNPGRMFVMFGDSITIVPTIDGNPKAFTEKVDCSIGTVIMELSDKLEISEEDVADLLRIVGVRRTEEDMIELKESGIDDFDAYYSTINSFLEDCAIVLQEKIEKIREEYEMEESTITFVFGGIFDIPGIESIFGSEYVKFNIDTSVQNSRFILSNKTNNPISSIYATAVGATLNNCFAHNINVLPKEKFLKSVDKYVIGLYRVAVILMIVFAQGQLLNLGYNAYKLYKYKDASSESKVISRDLQKVNSNIEKINEFIEASESTDGYLKDMLEFINASNSDVFSVASVDTKSMVYIPPKAPVKKEEPINIIPKKDEEKPVEQQISITKALGINKEPIIVRGYSVSTSEISKFYDSLGKLKYIKTSTMKSISKEVLPSLEEIYIFEIELQM